MPIFLVHLILLIWCSALVARRIVTHSLDRCLATFVCVWVNLFLTALILASFHQLGNSHAYFRTSLGIAFVVAAFSCWWKKPAALLVRETQQDGERSPFGEALLVVGFAMFAAMSGYVCWKSQISNFDSLTYHLPRLHFYLGQGHLGHFETANFRQTFFPFGGTLFQIFLVIYQQPSELINLFNLAAWLVAVLAVYRITRECGAGIFSAMLAAWLGGTATQVIAQATSTTNDIQAAAVLLLAFLFGLEWWRERRLVLALTAGTALGLAISVKLTLVFFLPPLGVLGVGLLWRYAKTEAAKKWKRDLAHILSAGTVASVFILPFAVINYACTGKLMTSEHNYALNRPFEWKSMVQTTVTFVTQFLADPFQRMIFNTREATAWASANYELNKFFSKRLFFWWNPHFAFSELYIFPPDLSEDHVFFGFIGFLFLMVGALFAFRRRLWATPAFWCVFLSAGWFLAYCASSKWSLYNQRYFVSAVLLAAPGIAFLYEYALRARPFWKSLTLLVIGGVVCTNVLQAYQYLTANPLRGLSTIIVYHRAERRTKQPAGMEKMLAGSRRIHFVYAGHEHVNEPLYLLMDLRGKHQFTISKSLKDHGLNVLSHWTPSNSTIYPNIPATSTYTLVAVDEKKTPGVFNIGTVQGAVQAYNYYGYIGGGKGIVKPENSNIMLTVEMDAERADRLGNLTAQFIGLHPEDGLRADVYSIATNSSRQLLFTTSRAERHELEPSADYAALGVDFVDSASGALKGHGRLDVTQYNDFSIKQELLPLRSSVQLIAKDVEPLAWVDGMRGIEGPHRKMNLPAVRWALSPGVKIRFRLPNSDAGKPVSLCFSARPQIEKTGRMDIRINGGPATQVDFEQQEEWLDRTVDLPTVAGLNVLELTFTKPPNAKNPNDSLQMLFRDLHIFPAVPSK